MPSKNPAQRLCDIIDNVEAIDAFSTGLDFAAFRANRSTVYAVVRAIEIISEASRRLPSVAPPPSGDRLGGSRGGRRLTEFPVGSLRSGRRQWLGGKLRFNLCSAIESARESVTSQDEGCRPDYPPEVTEFRPPPKIPVTPPANFFVTDRKPLTLPRPRNP